MEAWPPPRRGPGESDAERIRRAKMGDQAAMELVQAHFRAAYNFAYKLCGNPDDASDIVQETFLRVIHALPSFRGDANFTTWLYRIVTNVFLDERKKQQVRQHSSLEEFYELEDSAVARQIQDPALGPEMLVVRIEQAEMVQEAVSTLPPNQRVMIALYHFEGRSYEEIAAIMGLPIGTVKSRLNRARLALKNKLQSKRELLDS